MPLGRPFASFLAATLLSCGGSPQVATPGGVRATVTATDGRSGAPCDIVINSAEGPFYSPVMVQTKVGEPFESHFTTQHIDDVFVEVRCAGYDTTVVSPLVVRPNQTLEVGDIKVRTLAVKP